MDESPQLPLEPELAPPLEAALPPPPKARVFARDAAVDLVASISCGAAMVVLYTVIAMISGLTRPVGGNRMIDALGGPWGIVGLLLATELPMLYFAFRRRRRNREKGRAQIPLFNANWGRPMLNGFSAGMGMVVLSVLYTSTLQRFLGEDSVPNQLDFLKSLRDNRGAVAALVFIVSVMAPIAEEIFFRGAVFGSAKASGRTAAGAAISAVLFGLVHLSPLLFPFYATFALVMCWLYSRTGTLIAPIAAHMTMNGMACLAILAVGGTQV